MPVPLVTIDDYLAGQPPEAKKALEQLRRVIHRMVPDVEETLSYQIPTFKFHGALVSFAVAKNHCSFYIMSTPAMKELTEDLAGFRVSGTAVHFTPEQPLPDELVEKILKVRCAENQAKAKK